MFWVRPRLMGLSLHELMVTLQWNFGYYTTAASCCVILHIILSTVRNAFILYNCNLFGVDSIKVICFAIPRYVHICASIKMTVWGINASFLEIAFNTENVFLPSLAYMMFTSCFIQCSKQNMIFSCFVHVYATLSTYTVGNSMAKHYQHSIRFIIIHRPFNTNNMSINM